MMSRATRLFALALLALALLTAPALAQTEEVVTRLGEQLAVARLSDQASRGLADRWAELHGRCAERLLRLCVANGGLYVKLGQHCAQLDYLVPEPYTRALHALFEHNEPSAIGPIITYPCSARAGSVCIEDGADRSRLSRAGGAPAGGTAAATGSAATSAP